MLKHIVYSAEHVPVPLIVCIHVVRCKAEPLDDVTHALVHHIIGIISRYSVRAVEKTGIQIVCPLLEMRL